MIILRALFENPYPVHGNFERTNNNSFTGWAQAQPMEQRYRAYADEAVQLADRALKESDRQFWLSIARAWMGLIDIYAKPNRN